MPLLVNYTVNVQAGIMDMISGGGDDDDKHKDDDDHKEKHGKTKRDSSSIAWY